MGRYWAYKYECDASLGWYCAYILAYHRIYYFPQSIRRDPFAGIPSNPQYQSDPCPPGAVRFLPIKDHRNQEVPLPPSMVLERLLQGLRNLARASPRRVHRYLRKVTRFLTASWRLCYILHLAQKGALVKLSIYLLLSLALPLVPYRYRRAPRLRLRSLFRLRGFLARRRRCT